MGVATWKTPVQPLIASSKLPSSARSAFQRVRCVSALGKSSKCFTFFTLAEHKTVTKSINHFGSIKKKKKRRSRLKKKPDLDRERWPEQCSRAPGASWPAMNRWNRRHRWRTRFHFVNPYFSKIIRGRKRKQQERLKGPNCFVAFSPIPGLYMHSTSWTHI